jgi:AraC-like DNA-binding protein
MKEEKQIRHIKTISQLHKILGLDSPRHPLVSLVYLNTINWSVYRHNTSYVWDFYMISIKYGVNSFIYGRTHYDFEEGTMVFTAPGQILRPTESETEGEELGWTLFIHPDLIRKTGLAERMSSYSFFSYAINEGLHLSDEEKVKINSIVNDIEKEYSQNMDRHSLTLIVSNIELLLNHCVRFYDRQFYTRSLHQKDVVIKTEQYLVNYFNSEESLKQGLPTVKMCAGEVNLSPNYLSDLLKKETGRNTQDHIHFYLIEKAKNLLLSTNMSVNQIAYQLGFEYPQYFGNLFKKKTGISPNEYRNIS